MRILFVSLYNYEPWGGSEDLWVKTAEYAAKQGHQVMASIYDFGKDTSPKMLNLSKAGVVIHFRKRIANYNSHLLRLKIFILNRFKILDKRLKPINDFNPEVIFINDPGTFTYVRSYNAIQDFVKKKSIPYMIVCKLTPDYGSSISDDLREKARKIFIHASKMFFVSHCMHKNVERYLARKLDNSIIVQNPLNLKNFSIIKFPDSREEINFAIVAHLGTSQKGHHILFEVLSDKFWQNKKWILNIYGNGPDKKYLIELTGLYNLSNKIIFHDRNENIERIWEKNHILLFPTAQEGMPKALLEAMVCGRPVLATEVGGIPEVVSDKYTGYLAEAPSVSSFGRKLRQTWDDKENWKQIGINAHNEIIKYLDKRPERTLLHHICNF